MRPEQLYLTDILEAAQAIATFCAQVRFDQFEGNDMLRSAVLQKLIVIGEAVTHLPDKFCRQHPEIPWLDMINFRNFAVHEYFAVNWHIVWDTAIEDIPPLEEQIKELLKQFSM
jgi:uncharacterized protein with HEPN domain